jgi:hypothetical protein
MNCPGPEAQADYRIETCAPGDLTAAEMERCTTIVIEGEAIENPDSVKTWLPRSVVLAVVRRGEEIVGVGAIKPARPRYAARVAAASDHVFAADVPELGYIARDPTHRNNRLSPRIVAALLERHGGGMIWATTSSTAIKAALTDAGFRRHGREWEKPAGRLSLWLKDSQAPQQP